MEFDGGGNVTFAGFDNDGAGDYTISDDQDLLATNLLEFSTPGGESWSGGLVETQDVLVASKVDTPDVQGIWFAVRQDPVGFDEDSLSGTFYLVNYVDAGQDIASFLTKMVFHGNGTFSWQEEDSSGTGTYSFDSEGMLTITYAGQTIRGALSGDRQSLVAGAESPVRISFGIRNR